MKTQGAVEKNIKYLESLLPENPDEIEQKYWGDFETQAFYLGNSVYSMNGLYSTDTRELFLMYILEQEKIDYETK